MVKIVLIEVVGFVSVLVVDVPEVLLPQHFWNFRRIHVDLDEVINVDLNMDPEEAVLLLVELVQLLIPRSFGQFAI